MACAIRLLTSSGIKKHLAYAHVGSRARHEPYPTNPCFCAPTIVSCLGITENQSGCWVARLIHPGGAATARWGAAGPREKSHQTPESATLVNRRSRIVTKWDHHRRKSRYRTGTVGIDLHSISQGWWSKCLSNGSLCSNCRGEHFTFYDFKSLWPEFTFQSQLSLSILSICKKLSECYWRSWSQRRDINLSVP